MAIETKVQPQLFRLRTQLMAQGRLDTDLAKTDEMTVRMKCYAQGGENELHMHVTEDHIFVVLDGTLEARDDDRVVGVLREGEVFGEMAFLLERPRSLDIYAANDARVLSLSESTLKKMVTEDPAVAAKVDDCVARRLPAVAVLRFSRILAPP